MWPFRRKQKPVPPKTVDVRIPQEHIPEFARLWDALHAKKGNDHLERYRLWAFLLSVMPSQPADCARVRIVWDTDEILKPKLRYTLDNDENSSPPVG